MLIRPCTFPMVVTGSRVVPSGAPDRVAPPRPEAPVSSDLQLRAARANLVQSFRLEPGYRIVSLTLGPGKRLCATSCNDAQTRVEVIEPDGRVSMQKTAPREEDNFYQTATLSRDGQRIHVAQRSSNSLTVLDSTTGEELWTARHVARRASLEPTRENADGSLYFAGSGFGSLWSAQGQFQWEFDQGDFSTRAHAFHDGTAYQGGNNGLVAVREGKVQWHLPRPDESVYEDVTPTEDGVLATLSIPFGEGTLQSLDAAGKVRWSRNFPSFLGRPLIGRDGSVLVVDSTGVLHALAPEDGASRWSRNLAFTSTADLFRETGPRGYPLDPAVDDQGNLYIGWDDRLHCLAPDGKLRGTLQLDVELARIQSPLLAPDGTLYLYGGGNQVMAIDTRGLLAFRSSAQLDETAAIQVSPSGVRIGGVLLPVRRRQSP